MKLAGIRTRIALAFCAFLLVAIASALLTLANGRQIEQTTRLIAEGALRQLLGCDVYTAENGRDALAIALEVMPRPHRETISIAAAEPSAIRNDTSISWSSPSALNRFPNPSFRSIRDRSTPPSTAWNRTAGLPPNGS